MAGIDNNTLLYLRGDSFSDLSLNPKSITNNGVTISENGKFSKGLVLGSNQYLQIINGMQGVDLSKDFTIEWWEYSTLKSSNSAIFTNKINAGSFSVGFLLGFEGTKTFMGNSSANWNGFDATVSKDKTDNIWVHWRFVKKGTQWMSYKNGIKFWATTTTVTPGKSDGDNCTIGAWLENSTIKSGYNAIISDFRISNIARCSENFTPPTQPFNSIDINITNQTDVQIDFNITKLGQEAINKVEVLVNGIVSETYTDNYDNINYLIDTELCTIGNNDITIRVTFDDTYTEELSLNHKVTVDELPLETPLLDTVERVKTLTTLKQSEKTMLSSILTSKNVEVSEEDKMSDLIYKVNDLGEFIQPILYIYKEGDECINVTGGWDFNNCSYSSAFSKNNGHLTKNSTNFYGTLPTYWSIYYRGTSNKIDLSNYNKLKCKISNYTSATNSAFDIYVSYEDANFLNKTPVASARNTTTGESVLELDISQIFSAYNIFISLFCGSASGGAGASVTVSEIWLEV